LKRLQSLLIVPRMKKSAILTLLLLLAAVPLAAQNAVGFSIGGGQTWTDDFEFDFGDSVKEVYFETSLEQLTTLRLRIGRLESEIEQRDVPGPPIPGDIDYVHALIGYRFYEVFGSTSLFAGPGFYRYKFGGQDASEWGIGLGVNGIFPVTRRLSLVAELGYHWINGDDFQNRLLTATGGLRIGF
jgi:hypothetical protein